LRETLVSPLVCYPVDPDPAREVRALLTGCVLAIQTATASVQEQQARLSTYLGDRLEVMGRSLSALAEEDLGIGARSFHELRHLAALLDSCEPAAQVFRAGEITKCQLLALESSLKKANEKDAWDLLLTHRRTSVREIRKIVKAAKAEEKALDASAPIEEDEETITITGPKRNDFLYRQSKELADKLAGRTLSVDEWFGFLIAETKNILPRETVEEEKKPAARVSGSSREPLMRILPSIELQPALEVLHEIRQFLNRLHTGVSKNPSSPREAIRLFRGLEGIDREIQVQRTKLVSAYQLSGFAFEKNRDLYRFTERS
jgi:hypothetical protein